MNAPRIVVVGSSNTDMVVKSKRLPAPGETVTGGAFAMVPGGKGANQAVAAARQGAEVTFVARVGDDMFGQRAIEGYAREGIDTRHVRRDAELATGIALILVDELGENLISVASGANHALSTDDVDAAREQIAEADAVMLQLEIPLGTAAHAAALATKAGVPVILDPAPAPDEPLPEALLRNVTYLTPNEGEATRMTGIDVVDEDSARRAAGHLLAKGPRNVLVTLGAKGVLVASDDDTILIPSVPVDAVDSTAAGDAFNGGFAAALGRRLQLHDAVALASRVGALSVTKIGAQPSLPTAAELQSFVKLS